MLSEHDTNHDGVISWEEFVTMMGKFKGEDNSKFGIITGSVMTIEDGYGGKHTYSIEERGTFARLINNFFKNDPDL